MKSKVFQTIRDFLVLNINDMFQNFSCVLYRTVYEPVYVLCDLIHVQFVTCIIRIKDEKTKFVSFSSF